MVPLIARSEYFDELRKNSKFEAFYRFIMRLENNSLFTIESDIDRVFADAIISIDNSDSIKFKSCLETISSRTPKSTSPFVNDDLLLLVLVVGVKKFNLQAEPIRNILNVRDSGDQESKMVTKTFLNILGNNYKSLENAFQILIVIEDLTGFKLLSREERLHFYRSVSPVAFPFYKSDFLNTLSVRAFDVMLSESLEVFNGGIDLLRAFDDNFQKRARTAARIIQVILTVGLSFGLYRLAILIPAVNEFFQNFEPVLGILGLSVLGNIIPAINRLFYGLILLFFKYPSKPEIGP